MGLFNLFVFWSLSQEPGTVVLLVRDLPWAVVLEELDREMGTILVGMFWGSCSPSTQQEGGWEEKLSVQILMRVWVLHGLSLRNMVFHHLRLTVSMAS